MKPEQEPKYEARDGRIYNRASGEAIPDDEPVFIFRARDRRAAKFIEAYADDCISREHREIVRARVAQFRQFAAINPDRMKEPDTDVHDSPPSATSP